MLFHWGVGRDRKWIKLRFVVEDSVNCGGTNNIEQSGTATAEIILSEPHIILPLTLQESPD
jgi:hypothetical protein